jgi:hypothetical protein
MHKNKGLNYNNNEAKILEDRRRDWHLKPEYFR